MREGNSLLLICWKQVLNGALMISDIWIVISLFCKGDRMAYKENIPIQKVKKQWEQSIFIYDYWNRDNNDQYISLSIFKRALKFIGTNNKLPIYI